MERMGLVAGMMSGVCFTRVCMGYCISMLLDLCDSFNSIKKGFDVMLMPHLT